MFNFTCSQKITNLHNFTHSIFNQNKCINNQRGNFLNSEPWQKAWQRGKKRGTFDFKGFLMRGKRGTATNAAAWHQPPLPPLGGRGLPRSSRHGFYSLNIHMQCL
ncbi:TPA: hypothetical protein PIP00_001554 [Klebsiella pneumoniae]|nr:hypothetical protein [Klebsiella pneumoniae subsp. ozaenae]HDH0767282.1 hypothetical protein [Klebsiella pneumoniae]